MLKKCVFLLTFFTIIFYSCIASAQSGNIIGNIYSTDILAQIDGLNAPSYSIDGKTAIVIEELADKNSALTYAINAKYDDAERRLDVTMTSSKGFFGEQYNEVKRGSVGKVLGNVYDTDIEVFFNGYKVNAMNIGGKMAVAIEDLGQLGGINEEFGYSKYRCKATWKPDERIIALDFLDNSYSFSTFDYGNFLKYKLNDNVLSAGFDRMAICHSELTEISFSDAFKGDVNVLKPLFFEIGSTREKVGFIYFEGDTVDNLCNERLCITDKPLLKKLTENITDGKTPSADDAFKALDDNVNYKTLSVCETEDFYLATVEELKLEGPWNNIAYVLIKKTGGYGKIYSGSTYHTQRVVEKVGENIVRIGEGPVGDSRGKPTVMYCELNLNNYFVK